MRFRLTALRAELAAILAIAIGAALGPPSLTGGGAQKTVIVVGDKVPDFSLTTLDGKSFKLSELRKDKQRSEKGVVVLSFWCATCHSCRHVEEHLGKLAKENSGKAAVFAVDANVGDTPDEINAQMKKTGLVFPVVIDRDGRVADLFGITKTTTTLVIDGDGVLRYCGQFKQKDGDGSAENALKAVLAGHEVAVKTTPHKGCPIVRKNPSNE